MISDGFTESKTRHEPILIIDKVTPDCQFAIFSSSLRCLMTFDSRRCRLPSLAALLSLGMWASIIPAFGQQPGESWSPYRDQTTSQRDRDRQVANNRVRWPSPVRLAQFSEDPYSGSATSGEFFSAGDATMHHEGIAPPPGASSFTQSHPSHAVLRPPAAETGKHSQTTTAHPAYSAGSGSVSAGARHLMGHGLNDQLDQPLPAPPLHGENSRFGRKKWPLGPVQPRTASIPGGRERPVWKQPYSYGYFGASGNRRWETHHGYRDRYTEYRYR